MSIGMKLGMLGASGGASFITDGLVLHLDAADATSAPDGTSDWVNLVNGNTVARNGSPSLTTLGGATTWRFTSTGDYFESAGVITSGDEPATNATMIAWIYPEDRISTSSWPETIIKLKGPTEGYYGNQGSLYMTLDGVDMKLNNYWYNHPNAGYHETGAAITRDNWHSFASVYNYDDQNLYQYTNNVKTTASGTYGNQAPTFNVNIGREQDDRQFSGGIAFVAVYDRALSDDEITQNYDALKGRF